MEEDSNQHQTPAAKRDLDQDLITMRNLLQMTANQSHHLATSEKLGNGRNDCIPNFDSQINEKSLTNRNDKFQNLQPVMCEEAKNSRSFSIRKENYGQYSESSSSSAEGEAFPDDPQPEKLAIQEQRESLSSPTDSKSLNEQFELMLKRRYSAVYQYHDQTYEYAVKSLGVFSEKNFLRSKLVWLSTWSWFDKFIMVCIILNSGALALKDYSYVYIPSLENNAWNASLELIDFGFTLVFVFECVSKIIAFGFYKHKNAYLSNSWNTMDFCIVLISLISLYSQDSSQLKVLRTMRVLRPLRTISSVPSMRKLISTFFDSIPGLLNVSIFLAFFFAIFAIFGVVTFSGSQYNFCRATEEIVYPPDGGKPYWPIHQSAPLLCTSDQSCAEQLPPGELAKCGNIYTSYGLDPYEYDSLVDNELLQYDVVNFNHVGKASLLIFQTITLEGWANVMYNYQDSYDPILSGVFFLLVVFLGAFVSMNLFLATIIHSFVRSNERQKIEEHKALLLKQDNEQHEKALMAGEEDPKISPEKPITSECFSESSQKNFFSSDRSSKKNRSIARLSSGVLEQQELQARRLQQSVRQSESYKQNQKAETQQENTPKQREKDLEADLIKRARSNRLYWVCLHLVESVSFNFLVTIFIVANTVVLAMDRHDLEKETAKTLQVLNYFFTAAFLFEMILKLVGLGFRHYLRDKFNVFDGTIVLFSLVDLALEFWVTDLDTSFLTTIRALRLLRTIKLARKWTGIQNILRRMVTSLIDISNFSLLLLIVMFIISLLGMELFAYSIAYDQEGQQITDQREIIAKHAAGEDLEWPRINFNNALYALASVFIIITGEDWPNSMYLYVHVVKADGESYETQAVTFFMIVMVIGYVVLMALFTGIMLQNFEQDIKQQSKQLVEKELKRQSSVESLPEENQTGIRGYLRAFKKAFCSIFAGRNLDGLKFLERVDSCEPAGPKSGNEISTKRSNKILSIQTKRIQPIPEIIDEGLQSPADELVKNSQKIASNNSLQSTPISPVKFASIESNSDQKDPGSLRKSVIFLHKSEKTLKKQTALSTSENADNNFKVVIHRPKSLLHYDPSLAAQFGQKADKMKAEEIQGNALFCLSKNNRVRKFLNQMTNHSYFNNLILLLIVFSTVTLAFEDPLEPENSTKSVLLGKIDKIMTIIFLLESLLKIAALGFLFNGETSYLRDSWNVLDFLIVFSSFISLVFGDSAGDISFLKAFRFLRILRPLRTIKRHKGLKLAVTSLFKSIPGITNLTVALAFFLFILAILMTTIFSGTFYFCELPEGTQLSNLQQQELIKTKWDCINFGGEWIKPDMNFDSTPESLLTLSILLTREGWIDLMYAAVDSTTIDHVPKQNNNIWIIFVFCLIIIIIAMLFLNLFIGVVVQTFNAEKENMNPMLQAEQRTWLLIQIQTYGSRPAQKIVQEGVSKFRELTQRLISDKRFEYFITVAILLNTIVLASTHYNQTAEFEQICERLNYIFMVIFTSEAVIKIIALNCDYFHEGWNIFDFTVVVLSLTFLVITMYMDTNLSLVSLLLRTLRVGRMLRLVRRAETLMITFQTLIASAPAISSLGSLLVMLVFMFAIIGQSLFTGVKIEDGQSILNRHINFQSFWTSFITLFRCSTGEGWNAIMYDLGRQRSILFQCDPDETLEMVRLNGGVRHGCGSFAVSVAFSMLFQIIVGMIFLNLFIAIIIDAFLTQNDLYSIEPKSSVLQEFIELWSEYDPTATGFITIEQLFDFIQRLAESPNTGSIFIPTERENVLKSENARASFIASLRIPTFDKFGKVLFYDTLQQMSMRVNSYHHNKSLCDQNSLKLRILQMFSKKNSQLNNTMKKSFDAEEGGVMDFNEVINSLHVMSHKIELLKDLKNKVKSSFVRYFKLVDTTQNLALTPEERLEDQRSNKLIEVLSKLEDFPIEVNVICKNQNQQTEIKTKVPGFNPRLYQTDGNTIEVTVLTTQDYYAAKYILDRLKNFMIRKKVQSLGSMVLSHHSMDPDQERMMEIDKPLEVLLSPDALEVKAGGEEFKDKDSLEAQMRFVEECDQVIDDRFVKEEDMHETSEDQEYQIVQQEQLFNVSRPASIIERSLQPSVVQCSPVESKSPSLEDDMGRTVHGRFNMMRHSQETISTVQAPKQNNLIEMKKAPNPFTTITYTKDRTIKVSASASQMETIKSTMKPNSSLGQFTVAANLGKTASQPNFKDNI